MTYFDVASSQILEDGVPCKHVGCISHISHPCESCGRIAGEARLFLDKRYVAQSDERFRDLVNKWVADHD